MKTVLSTLLFLISLYSFSQKLLASWSQQNIEFYTMQMYDEAQKLTADQLLEKNLQDKYWSEVFLTINASINHHSKDINYLKSLAEQITDKTETKLMGTSRLVIWDRISNGDIIFEGKGIIIDNDLFTVAGRANQILQNLTNKNFGFVTIDSDEKELQILKNKWIDYLNDIAVEEFKPNELENAEIAEVSSLSAVKALIISLQDNPKKDDLTKRCLKKIYNLDEMPKGKNSPAIYCNPDTYTFSYLNILFGYKNIEPSKDAKWWLNFWDENHHHLVWDNENGIYKVIK